MDEIILICDHSNTIEKRKNLLDLILKLREKYKVALVSHVNLGSDIVDSLDYYFYNKDNNLNYDYNLKIFKYFKSETLNINYKPIQLFSTHIFAILNMLIPAMAFLKSSGCKILHVFEYDLKIKNFNIFEENKKKLESFDFIGYKKTYTGRKNNHFYTHSGEFFSIKLDNIDYELLNFPKNLNNHYTQVLIQLFNENNHTVAELLFYEIFVKKIKHLLIDQNLLNEYVDYNLQDSRKNNNIQGLENNIVFILDQQTLKVFNNCVDESKDRVVTLIIDNSKVITYDVKKYTWFIKTTNISNFEFIKVYIDDKFLTEITMKSPYIVKLNKNEK